MNKMYSKERKRESRTTREASKKELRGCAVCDAGALTRCRPSGSRTVTNGSRDARASSGRTTACVRVLCRGLFPSGPEWLSLRVCVVGCLVLFFFFFGLCCVVGFAAADRAYTLSPWNPCVCVRSGGLMNRTYDCVSSSFEVARLFGYHTTRLNLATPKVPFLGERSARRVSRRLVGVLRNRCRLGCAQSWTLGPFHIKRRAFRSSLSAARTCPSTAKLDKTKTLEKKK